MNSSASTILAHATKLLRTDMSSTDLEAMQESFLLTLCSQANMEYLEAFQRGGSGPVAQLRETGFDLVADTALAEDTDLDEENVTVDDSDDFEASDGAFIVWDDGMPDIATYETNDIGTETFSGVSGLAFNHEEGDVVQRLFKLPASFGRFRPADGYGDGVQINGTPYRFVEGPPQPGQFSMYDDGTNKYFWPPRGLSGAKASILYEKTSTVIDDTADVIDVPPEHEFFVVWRIVDLALFAREDSQLRAEAKMEWRKKLKDALKAKSIGNQIRPRPIGRGGMTRETYSLTHQEQ